jgi:ribosomal protein S18 acetylase RimI-like enzyme
VIGRAAYRLRADAKWRAEEGAGGPWKAALRREEVFVYTRVPVQAVPVCETLAAHGFRLVDTTLTFEKTVGDTPPSAPACTVRAARKADAGAVVALAGSSFSASRFHADPRFPDRLAVRIKARWAESYFAGRRGEQMGVACLGGRLVGFVLILHLPGGLQVIDLIAVEASARRRGVGQALVGYAEAEAAARGARLLRVGTQAGNVPSARLYEGCGFRFASAAHLYHFHQPDWADDENQKRRCD